MKSQIKNRLGLFRCHLLLIAAFVACSYDEPPLVFDPSAPGNAAPKINSVEPQGAAFAGFTEIKIAGDNFSARLGDNLVYFGNEKGQITSVSKTEIKVISPNRIEDNLTIKVVVAGALAIAQFSPYQLKAVSTEYGNFTNLDQVFAIAVDANENLYAHMRTGSVSVVVKVAPDGAKTEFGRTPFPQALEMQIGPGVNLYLHRSLGNLFRIGAGGGEAQPFATLPARTATFDFDANGNIFAAGNRSGVFAVSSGGEPTATNKFLAYDVRTVRVFNDYVYVAALFSMASKRSGLTMSAKLLIFLWHSATSVIPYFSGSPTIQARLSP